MPAGELSWQVEAAEAAGTLRSAVTVAATVSKMNRVSTCERALREVRTGF